jgi:hypothetical protein
MTTDIFFFFVNFSFPLIPDLTLEETRGAITKGQSRKTGNTRHKAETNKAKQKPINKKHNTENLNV